MAKTQPVTPHTSTLRTLVSAALLLAAVYILVRNRGIVTDSLRVAVQSSPAWLLAALAAMMLTFFIAAAAYSVLALHRLRYRDTLLIALAAAFTSRLGPAGLGGMGLNGIYLYRRGHTGAEATAVVSVNNLLGVAAHILLLIAAVLLWPDGVADLFDGHRVSVDSNWTIAALFIVCLVLLARPVRRRVAGFLKNLAVSVRKIGVKRIGVTLLIAACMTAAYTAILQAAAYAVGVHLHVFEIFIVFSVGMLAGTATPTPGGLVGAEAGLFAGLTGYHVSGDSAGAVVMLFRFVTYWLPIVPGMVALAAARRRRLV